MSMLLQIFNIAVQKMEDYFFCIFIHVVKFQVSSTIYARIISVHSLRFILQMGKRV